MITVAASCGNSFSLGAIWMREEFLRAVRFYEGDVSGLDPFWGEKSAYQVLNALFFPGMNSEMARICEGGVLKPVLLERAGCAV